MVVTAEGGTDGSTDTSTTRGRRRAVRPRSRLLLPALAPAAVYLAVRLVGVLVLGVMAGGGGKLYDALHAWDGAWLLAIAQYGYFGVPDDMLDAYGNHTSVTPLGFFPGYPALVSVTSAVTGGELVFAGLLVALVAGVFAAYGIARLGTIVPGGSPRAGLLLVGLFAASPMGVVLSMTYTEALFCAFAAWSLVGVLRRQWLLAGLGALGAGLVRPTAAALVVAVGLAALAAVLQRRDGWRPWLGGALAACGLFGYLGYVALVTGRLDGWSRIQRDGWGWYLDGGRATLRFTGAALANGSEVFDLAIVVALATSLVLFAVSIRMRLPWPLLVYGGLVLAIVWGSEGLSHAKLRLLLPAFTLLLPVAIGLARRRTGTAVAVVVAAALASAWYGGYALTIWRYGI